MSESEKIPPEVPDPWIIEEEEKRKRRREDEQRPELPVPQPPPDWPKRHPPSEDPGEPKRGVEIIEPPSSEP